MSVVNYITYNKLVVKGDKGRKDILRLVCQIDFLLDTINPHPSSVGEDTLWISVADIQVEDNRHAWMIFIERPDDCFGLFTGKLRFHLCCIWTRKKPGFGATDEDGGELLQEAPLTHTHQDAVHLGG